MTGPLDTDGHTMAVAFETLQAKGYDATHASTQETDPAETLRALREAFGAQAFTEWGSRVLNSLQSSQVLRDALHGSGIRRAAREAGLWLDDGALPCAQGMSSEFLRRVWQDGPDGCSPQGRGLAQQLARELGQALPFLPPEGASGIAVRRLTPTECERLMGFPDDFTLVPYRNKPAADGPRYKALGNSMAVPVMRWIGERIQGVQAIKDEGFPPPHSNCKTTQESKP